jgi:lipoprotein-releasing system permease protein
VANAMIVGVDPDDAVQMERLQRRFSESNPDGHFDITGTSLVLSIELVDRLLRGSDAGFTAGESRVNVFGPSYINEVVSYSEEKRAAQGDAQREAAVDQKEREYPLPAELTVTGIYSDAKQAGLGFVSLKTAQRLAGSGTAVDGLMVDIADPFKAGEMAQSLEQSGLLPPGWQTVTWMERHRELFDAVANERGMMYIVLGFISVVAAFCIMNTMITMAVQKRREIGMMRALGARTSQIVAVFVAQGLVVATLGVGLGYALGMAVLTWRNELRRFINDHFAWKIFDERIYGLREIPAELRPIDVIIICGIAFILCTLAAVPPALAVGRMAPARALRNDR